jgi:hypothetical protein
MILQIRSNSNKGTKSDMGIWRTSYAQRNYAYVAPSNYRRDSSSQFGELNGLLRNGIPILCQASLDL